MSPEFGHAQFSQFGKSGAIHLQTSRSEGHTDLILLTEVRLCWTGFKTGWVTTLGPNAPAVLLEELA